ncbi:MAG: hypothetical protein ACJ749_09540, partial [Flavisolibacter sp.]
VTIILLYFLGVYALSKFGYEFNGLQLDFPVVLFLWWLSVMVDGLALQLFAKTVQKQKIFMASIVMNSLSYLFLYFFISNSH